MHIADSGSWMHDTLSRMKRIQYSTSVESVGQITHELVLVPSTYFDPDLFLLHAAAFQRPGGGVVAVGGTGGVGKTSLEIELRRRRGFQFVADDIAVVSKDGNVWPNLAYPKVYGYNVVGDTDLQREVMRGRSAMDRVNWRLRSGLGLASVRRRVSPIDLYGSYSATGGSLEQYVFLAREHRTDFSVRRATGAELASLSVPIMKAEYGIFHQYLEWHEVNRRLEGCLPAVRTTDVFQRWERLAAEVLEAVDCWVVRGPIGMDHRQFVDTVASLVVSGTPA